jgi:hypothetical protein
MQGWFCRLEKCKSFRVMEASTGISKAGLGFQPIWKSGSSSLHRTPERGTHKSGRMKPKPQWQSQDVEDARSTEFLLRKATGNEWSQSKRDQVGKAA